MLINTLWKFQVAMVIYFLVVSSMIILVSIGKSQKNVLMLQAISLPASGRRIFNRVYIKITGFYIN